MNFDRFFKQVGSDWQQFGLMGVGPLLLGLGTAFVMGVLGVALLGPGIIAMIRADQFGGPGPGEMFAFFGSFAGFFVVALVVGVISSSLTHAGLVGTVVGYRRGERVSLAGFWHYATAHFGKMILLGLILAGLTILGVIVSAILLIIPPVGVLALMLVQFVVTLNLGLYPAYLIIAEGRGVGEAVGIGFKVITDHIGEALLGSLILFGFLIAAGMIGAVPVIGWIVVAVFAQPLITYFFIERFETEVRPKLMI